MNKNPLYDREQSLRYRLNDFFVQCFDMPETDYYSQLNAASLLRLKSALSDINNILTLQVTLAFADWAIAKLLLDEETAARLRASVLGAKPSSNGYDIWLDYPIAFVGEVKCNIPINSGVVYGAAQRSGIEKDIDSLLNGKRKAGILSRDCLKFMAFLDTPEIRQANMHLVRTSKRCKEKLVFGEGAMEVKRTDVVYGVYLTLGNDNSSESTVALSKTV